MDGPVVAPRTRGALAGLKVVELAHVIAGPLAGTLLADLGAEVVHVEAPGVGDTARTQGPAKDGVHLWWKVPGRNKRSVTLDLRTGDGHPAEILSIFSRPGERMTVRTTPPQA